MTPSAGAPGNAESPAGVAQPLFAQGDFAKRVAAARGLPERRPAQLVFHAGDSFMAALTASAERSQLGPTVVDTPIFQLAFGFGVLSKATSPPYAKTHREHVIAFYDAHEHSVHARRQPEIDGGEAALELVVAHELGHALQAQHFFMPELKEIDNEDRRLAQLALLEGDAMLTMLAYQARESFVPLSRRLASVQDRGSDAATFARASGVEQEAAQMSALTRTRLEFPYVNGLTFIGELYRAAGFELVNRVYAAPPVSTEQILHPARYLQGDEPLQVPLPEAPPGYTAVAHGSVGELLTRLALSMCMSAEDAIVAAEGWGGDSFLALEKDGLGGLLWATSWDTTDDAKQFERAVQRVAKCWEDMQLKAQSVFAGPATVILKDRQVAVVRGIPGPIAKKASLEMLRPPRQKKDRRAPFARIKLRSIAQPVALPAAHRAGERVIAPRLGFSARVPAGYTASFDRIVSLHRERPVVSRISVRLSDWMATGRSRHLMFEEYKQAVQKELAETLEPTHAERERQTSLGPARERSWRVKGHSLVFSLLVIPVCRNSGSLVVALVGDAPQATREQDQWLQTLSWVGDEAGGVCAILDP